MTPLSPDAHRWIATGPRSETCSVCRRRRLADGRWRTREGAPGEGPLPPCAATLAAPS